MESHGRSMRFLLFNHARTQKEEAELQGAIKSCIASEVLITILFLCTLWKLHFITDRLYLAIGETFLG